MTDSLPTTGQPGWSGKILRADLTTGTLDELRLPEGVYRAFAGGRGLGGWLLRRSLLEHGPLPCDDPRTPLTLAIGPLTATAAPASGRAHFVARSPLTGAVGDASAGGRLATELRRAGWDGVLIVGRAERPVGIEIDDGRAAVVDAAQFSGRGTDEIFAELRRKPGGGSLVATGPAAENGCLFASLVVDGRHMAERCGLGRVAALKNLKYLAVRGGGRARVADPTALKKAREDILRLTAASPALLGQHGLAHFGTAALLDLMDSRRMTPTDNFSRSRFPRAASVNAHACREAVGSRRHGCLGCHVACIPLAERGSHAGLPLPGFEALGHFTALIGNADLALEAHALCLRLGLDPASAAATLACHREITGEDLPAPRLLELLRGMANGSELGLGSARYAARLGRPELSMSVKGLELGPCDPRGAYGMALGMAVSTRGGCHLRALALSHEILRKPVATDRFSFSGKARMTKGGEDAVAAAESLGLCPLMLLAASLEEYARAFAAVTGIATTAQNLLAVGERTAYQERLINAAYGFDAAHDDLPTRFFTEPGSGDATLAVPPLPRQDFLNARAAYYRVRGLTGSGLPTRERAELLGLSWGGP